MILITHAKWSKQALGIATNKLSEGENMIKCTVQTKDGPLIPEPFAVIRNKVIEKYGPEEEINKNGLIGIFIPIKDIRNGTVNEINT